MDKLARERKDIRVTRDAKDAIDSKTIRSLQFNGREIRNGESWLLVILYLNWVAHTDSYVF